MHGPDPHRPAEAGPARAEGEPEQAPPAGGSSPGSGARSILRVRLARPEDVPELVVLSREVYSGRGAWLTSELRAHQQVFPEGQLVAVDPAGDRPLAMAVSLVVRAADWPLAATWAEITAGGMLTTHDPEHGDTLYGAGLAVRPQARGRGAARLLYGARQALLERLGLARIRAGARLAGYRAVAGELSPEEYVEEVAARRRRDPALSFQLHMGFRVLGVARGYLPADRESMGHAAVVEWTPAAR